MTKSVVAKAWSLIDWPDGSKRSYAQPVGGTTALRFPSNVSGTDQSAPYAVLQFANPHSNGLPFWGPSNQGVTVFRRIRTFGQTGYYAQFWYTDDSSFESSFGGSLGYYGFHPYPTSQSPAGTSHVWEIAASQGDFLDYLGRSMGSASPIDVVHNTWLTQAFRVVRNGVNSKTMTFYTNLPSIADADKIEVEITTANYGEANPPQAQPMLTIGDSPWYSIYQHERGSCDIAQQMIIAKALSDADIVTQSANLNSLVVADAIANIWWGKNEYANVDDLTCDFGTGRSFTRNDASNLLSVVSTS